MMRSQSRKGLLYELLDQENVNQEKKTRVEAAIGNMRTHLRLDQERPVWTTVNKQDLEVILDYINKLKLAPAEALEEFAEFITDPREEGLDERTLREVALEARHQANKLRTGD